MELAELKRGQLVARAVVLRASEFPIGGDAKSRVYRLRARGAVDC